MSPHIPTLVVLAALSLVPAMGSVAEDNCKNPPTFVGVPTGTAAFDVTGSGAKAGETRYLNFGDELVVSGGEGGMQAVTLFGVDRCGLWLQHAKGDSYLLAKPKLEAPWYTVVKANDKGVYEIEALGARFVLEQVFPGRFRVTLAQAIPPYVGE